MLTNSLNLPQPFVDAATSDYRYTPKRYSVTRTQSCDYEETVTVAEAKRRIIG